MAPLNYSGTLARQHDRDRYLASLFARPCRRPGLWALYAFNYEIAKTREVVSDTTLGLIRLQWWRDALTAIYNGALPPAHDVAQELAAAIKAYQLPRDLFEQLLYAREFDLEDQSPDNLQGMENYADFTSTPLLRLGMMVAREADFDPAPLAKAYALAGLLCAVPFHLRQSRCYLPADLLRLEGLTLDQLYAGHGEGLKPVIQAVAARAADLLKNQRPKGRMARVIAAQARIKLNHLKRLDFNVMDPRTALQPPFYEPRLWLASLLS
jgi:NADH dehydrogenase [ubiquinone] 1 alpha subcomplex assembly factor 6